LIENGWIEFMASEITMGLKNGARGVLIRIANQLFDGKVKGEEDRLGSEWMFFK